MRQTTCWCAAALFTVSPLRRKRFIPPWERDGKSAEDFFSGLMQSGNPIQQQRKQRRREEALQDAITAEDPMTPDDYRQLDEMHAHNESVLEQQRQFLPYGATPRRFFETSKMAAWGEYESNLLRSTSGSAQRPPGTSEREAGTAESGYSASTRQLLSNDLHDKIPYRITSLVLPRSLDGKEGSVHWPLHGSAGVVMDVDGVIYRSGQLIEGADTAVQTLQMLKIPVLFMTNSGGKSEKGKAEELSNVLGCSIDAKQVVVAHSPMRLLASEYRHDNVLIVGPPHTASIARDYGFENAIPILAYQAEHPEMLPYKKWGAMKTASPGSVPFPTIHAVLEFSEPTDPLSDAQTLLDVLTSPHGQVGTYVTAGQAIPYYVSADDLLWATEAPLPRLGHGAFREMMSSVFESVTGQGLSITMYGKPRAIAYAYAQGRLQLLSRELGWDPAKLRAIFMVGDNIETDIMGANAAGGPWTSVHVLSGIGSAPAARRTLSNGDTELEWLETQVSRVPHYVAPTLDHFVRELLAFPEEAVLQNRRPYYGPPNPVDLREQYNFNPEF